MKRLLLMSLAVSVSALVWSCKDDDQETGWGPGAPAVEISGSISIAQGIVWDADSRIGVFCEQAFDGVSYGIGNYPLAVTEGAGTALAQFATTLKPGYNTNYFKAYYRYSDTVSQNPVKVKGSLPKDQQQTDATKSHLGNYTYLYGACSMTAIDGVLMKVDFNFKSLLCVIELTLTPSDPEWNGKVTSVEITAPEASMLTGDFSVDFSQKEVLPVFKANTSVNSVKLTLSDNAGTISAGKPIKAWITTAAIDLTGKQLSVSVKTEARTQNYTVAGGNLKADEIYPISLELEK